uniref:Uncharacterized protein n=1 Tax=Arundo donax TaxID=35708 RepID=A0A0A8Y5Q0_ARUDO
MHDRKLNQRIQAIKHPSKHNALSKTC